MTHATTASKTTAQTEHATESPSAGKDAASVAPPEYGIDFIDRATKTHLPPAVGGLDGISAITPARPQPVLQTKLTVNQPGDVYEQEADRVADQVMRMADPASANSDGDRGKSLSPSLSLNGPDPTQVQRKCAACEEEEKQLQRKETSAGRGLSVGPVDAPPIVHDVLRSSGQPLDSASRTFFEPRFGRDFSDVRVHDDAKAAASARQVNAQAYTVGQNIVLGQQVSRHTSQGQRLMAHELTHVVQQGGAANPSSLQRVGDVSQAPPGMTCPIATSSPGPVDTDVFFSVGSSALAPKALADIASVIARWHALGTNETVRVDGYASVDGSDSPNWTLSCDRALMVEGQLMAPSSGDPGIPASFIKIFAHGETSEFSPAPEPNRRAMISANLTGPAPVPADTETKTVTIQPVAVANDDGSIPTAIPSFGDAIAIWRKCCINLTINSPIQVDQTAYKELDAPAGCTPRNEALALANAAAVSGNVISVFVPDTFKDGSTVGKNVHGGGFAADANTTNPKVFIVSGADGTVVAHELGHAMGHASCLGRRGHEPANTVMDPSGAHNRPVPRRVAAAICTNVRGFSGASGSGRTDCTKDLT